jgi:hypothetical protein
LCRLTLTSAMYAECFRVRAARVPLLGVCSAFANVEVVETTKSEIGQDGRNWLDDLASLPQLDELDHVLLDTSTHTHAELH